MLDTVSLLGEHILNNNPIHKPPSRYFCLDLTSLNQAKVGNT